MEGIDQAVGAKQKCEAMGAVAEQQNETVGQWGESVDKMERLVTELHQISDDMRQGADAISVGIHPIGEAATNFLTASSKLYEVLPSIQGASEGYVQAQTGLQDTAALATGTEAINRWPKPSATNSCNGNNARTCRRPHSGRRRMNQMEGFSSVSLKHQDTGLPGVRPVSTSITPYPI